MDAGGSYLAKGQLALCAMKSIRIRETAFRDAEVEMQEAGIQARTNCNLNTATELLNVKTFDPRRNAMARIIMELPVIGRSLETDVKWLDI